MFLGKAVILSVLILVLVQVIANTETCYLNTQGSNFESPWKNLKSVLNEQYRVFLDDQPAGECSENTCRQIWDQRAEMSIR